MASSPAAFLPSRHNAYPASARCLTPTSPQQGLHVLAKPTGPICNLACRYCFYLEKESLYPQGEAWKMSDETLRAFVTQYLDAQPDGVDEIDFAFQGGEPTLMGLDFFRRALALQKELAPAGMRIRNSLQTNGIKLDEEWCEFLKEHNFLVGLSIDGPPELHDRYRVDRKGEGTHRQSARRPENLLRKRQVEFNALVCVNRHNGAHPQRVYRYLRDVGVEYQQFIPIVEPRPGVSAWGPAPSRDVPPEERVTERSVLPGQFGRFLVAVFEEWVHRDVGRVFVRDFDQALAAWAGAGATLCVYAPTCGRATAIEHNGDLYSCDHYVFPRIPTRQHPRNPHPGIGQFAAAGTVRPGQVRATARLLPCMQRPFRMQWSLPQGSDPARARRPVRLELSVCRVQDVLRAHRPVHAVHGDRGEGRPSRRRNHATAPGGRAKGPAGSGRRRASPATQRSLPLRLRKEIQKLLYAAIILIASVFEKEMS